MEKYIKEKAQQIIVEIKEETGFQLSLIDAILIIKSQGKALKYVMMNQLDIRIDKVGKFIIHRGRLASLELIQEFQDKGLDYKESKEATKEVTKQRRIDGLI